MSLFNGFKRVSEQLYNSVYNSAKQFSTIKCSECKRKQVNEDIKLTANIISRTEVKKEVQYMFVIS